MKTRRLSQSLAAIGLLATMTGCKSMSWGRKESAFPDENRLVSVVITRETDAGPLATPDRDKPDEVIAFARKLSAAGRHQEAADIYQDAGARFESERSRFELDCQKAAVRECWLAGNISGARTLLDEMEGSLDLYERAAEGDSLRKLRALLTN